MSEPNLFTAKKIKKLLIPLIFEQFMIVLVGLVDTMLLSHVSESALSAFSLVGYEGQVRVIPLTQPVSRRLGVAVKAPPAANTAARYFLSFLKRQYAGA